MDKELPRSSSSAEAPNGSTNAASVMTFDDGWLENFYKECGREVTLAYTTLNQMKNWAIVTAAAAISGLAFGTAASNFPNVPMFTGTVIVYAFVLRFFIRAIICYVNLIRWNTLQKDCIELKLIPTGTASPASRLRLQTPALATSSNSPAVASPITMASRYLCSSGSGAAFKAA